MSAVARARGTRRREAARTATYTVGGATAEEERVGRRRRRRLRFDGAASSPPAALELRDDSPSRAFRRQPRRSHPQNFALPTGTVLVTRRHGWLRRRRSSILTNPDEFDDISHGVREHDG